MHISLQLSQLANSLNKTIFTTKFHLKASGNAKQQVFTTTKRTLFQIYNFNEQSNDPGQ